MRGHANHCIAQVSDLSIVGRPLVFYSDKSANKDGLSKYKGSEATSHGYILTRNRQMTPGIDTLTLAVDPL